MSKLTCDHIVIDTNVFEHILNPQKNTDDHIDTLLGSLIRDGVNLIVDEDRRIEGEYENRIKPMFRNISDEDIKLHLLQFWIEFQIDNRKRVCVSHNDRLMMAIKGVITEKEESVDRIFVYVAFKCDRILITNDGEHIIKGKSKERPERRRTLLKNTRKHRPNQRAEILSSSEAVARL